MDKPNYPKMGTMKVRVAIGRQVKCCKRNRITCVSDCPIRQATQPSVEIPYFHYALLWEWKQTDGQFNLIWLITTASKSICWKSGRINSGVWEQGAEENIWTEEKWGWRALYNEELQYLYSSPGIIVLIKSRKMRRARHVAWMGRRETRTSYWCENQKEGGH
jgi:hypothetical protein